MTATTSRDSRLFFIVIGLVIMVTWTVVIKYLAPILYYYSDQGASLDAPPIFWDVWPLAHLWLAWAIWRRSALAWKSALIISGLEVLVVIVRYIQFFSDPSTSFWWLLWFTNKIYVLLFFAYVFRLCFTRPFQEALSTPAPPQAGSPV